MRSFKSLAAVAFVLSVLSLLTQALPAHAELPAYLHALSDLRTARQYLEQDHRPKWAGVRNNVIAQIDLAIRDIKVAAADDGKNPDHTPPPQSEGDPRIPVRSAIRLLNEAYKDVSRGRDTPQNSGLQARSLQHIDRARRALEDIL